MADIVLKWAIPVGVHRFSVEFRHHTVAEEASVFVDDTLNLEHCNVRPGGTYIFELPHRQSITTEKATCAVYIRLDGNDNKYILKVNGMSFESYKKAFHKRFDVWNPIIGNRATRIVLDKRELIVWGRGVLLTSTRDFGPVEGVETRFVISGTFCKIITFKTDIIRHNLYVGENNLKIDPFFD
ncbi:hypothetical protein L3Y34_000474 [Caenorhabditis briggsae]|uniref:Uncharacterized protein n=1 Tax=Caenorhabditis briggsae TaxID=6238 RepID=A0AAE9D9N0_CAEBR|nr:hypothetical protein L3Y34_000474 [Caenorhabditis briggsae]